MYYKLYFRERKIPTPLALFFLVVLLVSLSLVVKRPKKVVIKAEKVALEQIEVANITYNSAAIFWRTSQPETGWVIYGEKERLNLSALDARDLEGKKGSYFNHYVELKNLAENTKYFFRILTQQRVILSSGGEPFQFSTYPKYSVTANVKPAFGKVVDKNSRPVKEAMVILRVSGVNPLTTLTKSTGEWLIPLYFLGKRGSSELLAFRQDFTTQVEVIGEDGEKAKIETTLGNLSPLPKKIVLGETFTAEEKREEKEGEAKGLTSKKIDLIFPKEKAVIPGRRPIFKGTAIESKRVSLTLELLTSPMTPRTFEIEADRQGVWSFIPTFDLEPGKYKINLVAQDEKGEDVKIARIFSILKSGEAVLAEATPEATLIPTQPPSPTPTETPTATVSATVTPSQPTSGINFIPLTITSSAFILLGLGLLIVF